MTDALPIEPHALATESASGSGASIDIGAPRSCVVLRLQVSALGGAAPSLSVFAETAPTAAGPWETLGTFAAQTALGTGDITAADAYQFVRVRWILLGTAPTAQFRVSGQAHTLYATPGDIAKYALPAKAIASVPADVQADACLAATDEAATYLAGRFTLPMISWGRDLTRHVAKMAGFSVMEYRGFQPQGADDLIVKGRDDAISYLRMIAKNELYPPEMVDSDTPDVGTNDSFVIDNPPSQWDVIGGGALDSTFGDLTTRN